MMSAEEDETLLVDGEQSDGLVSRREAESLQRKVEASQRDKEVSLTEKQNEKLEDTDASKPKNVKKTSSGCGKGSLT